MSNNKMVRRDNLNPVTQSALASRSKSDGKLGNEYEISLFMFLLTALPKSKHFDIGKQVKIADKFDDHVIRFGNEYTCIQAKLDVSEESLLDPDVFIGKKPLHQGGFNLLKYFVSYLRINDQFNSSDNQNVLKKLIIFTNIQLDQTTVCKSDIELVPSRENTGIDLPKTHADAKHYKIKPGNVLKQYLKKYLKSDLEILSGELVKYFTISHQLVYGKDSKLSAAIFKYYCPVLIDEKIIEQGKTEGKFTQKFIENHSSLSTPAKKLRKALIEFIQESTYGKMDEEDLIDKFQKPNFPLFDVEKVEKREVNLFSRLLLQTLASYIMPADECMRLNVDYLSYYHTALIEENVIAIQKTQKDNKPRGTVSQPFIENDGSLSNAAKKLRSLIPGSICSHAEMLEKYFEEAIRLQITDGLELKNYLEEVRSWEADASAKDPQNLKNRLGTVQFLISNDFGQSKSRDAKIYLPNYNITDESIDNFLSVLEVRLNELGALKLYSAIKNQTIKERFLMYCNWDPAHLEHQIKDFIKEWKNSGGSAAEGWILNSERKKFVHDLEMDISRPIAKHKTWEYEQDLNQKIVKFDIFFDNKASFQTSYFPSTSKIFYVKTNSVLLSSIKMLNYLKEKKLENYIFINVESLVKKEEIRELIKTFQDDRFNSLILVYESSFGNKLAENLFDDLSKILQNRLKRIFLITSASESVLVMKFAFKNNQFKQHNEKNIALADLKNPLKILEREVIFQDKPTALKMLVNQDDINSLKLINAKTLHRIFNNETIKIGCKPLATSDLSGAYAHVSEEVNKETFINSLVCNSSENIFVIGGVLFQDGGCAKKRFIQNLELSQKNNISNAILKKISVLTHPYSRQPAKKVIQLVDSEFEETNFKEFCRVHSENKVFWVKWDETMFQLQLIYNPNFYVNRKFNKVFVATNVTKVLKKQQEQDEKKDLFVFSGIDNSSLLAYVLELENNELDQTRVFVVQDTELARIKFNALKNTVHWLEVEREDNHVLINWRESKGSLKNLRECTSRDHSENLRQESELLQSLEDKQAVVFADDPGMGKSTTLVKLFGSNKIFTSHWVINVNLKDHLQAIRAIPSPDTNIDIDANRIKQFISKVCPNLDDHLSQSLLGFTLRAENNPKKPLLITFDGLDEVLDESDRKKVLSLLSALKEKTCAKFWVTTRLQHQELLEDALSTFSVTFRPLDEKEHKNFVRNFFQDRLRLLLNESKFHEIFDNVCDETSKMSKYTKFFLEKMESVFVKDLRRFIGTPLQLDLLLGSKGSVKEFQNWAEACPDSALDFDYLGKNVLEVYEKFIAGKYETYSRRTSIKEGTKQNYYFKHWVSDCKYIAKSIFLPESVSLSLEDKDMVLAPGLIKSHGDNLEFIHSTFGEYFVSEVFAHWIEKNVALSNTKKQKMLVKNILMNDSYQVIRSFMNARLANKLRQLPHKTLNEYGKIINEEFLNHRFGSGSNETPLHVAVKEGNAHIAAFLCNCIKTTVKVQQCLECNKYEDDSLKKFVAANDNSGTHALHIACKKGYHLVVKALLETFADDVAFLKRLLKASQRVCNLDPTRNYSYGWTALHIAAEQGHAKVVETLLQPFSDNVEFLKELMCICEEASGEPIVEIDENTTSPNEKRGWTALHLAAGCGSDEMVEKLLQPFTNDKEFLKNLLKASSNVKRRDASFHPAFKEHGWTVLHRAAINGHLNVVKKLTTPFIDDENFLEELITTSTKCRKSTVLHFLASREDSGGTIDRLLAPFTNDKKEKLIGIQTQLGNTALHNAAALGHDKVVQQLLSYFDKSVKEKFLGIKTEAGKTVFHLAVQSGHNNTVKKVFEPFSDKLKRITMRDNKQNTCLHIAAHEGHPNIVNWLLVYVKNIGDNWKTFKDLIEMKNNDGKTAFEIATNTIEINEVVKKFIDQAKKERAPNEIISLLSIINIDLLSNPKEKKVSGTVLPTDLNELFSSEYLEQFSDMSWVCYSPTIRGNEEPE